MNAIFKLRPLLPEEQKEFQTHGLSLLGEIDAVKRDNIRTLKIVAAASFLFGLGGLWYYSHPLERVVEKNHWIFGDTRTGYIAEAAGPDNAAKSFTQVFDEGAVKAYINAYYTYEKHTDEKRYKLVQIMSSPEVAGKYIKWHDSDLEAPRQSKEKNVTWDVGDHLIITKEPFDKGDTHRYAVQFWLRTNSGDTIGPYKQWSGEIAFQWHPEQVTNDDIRRDNPGGFVCVLIHMQPI